MTPRSWSSTRSRFPLEIPMELSRSSDAAVGCCSVQILCMFYSIIDAFTGISSTKRAAILNIF